VFFSHWKKVKSIFQLGRKWSHNTSEFLSRRRREKYRVFIEA